MTRERSEAEVYRTGKLKTSRFSDKRAGSCPITGTMCAGELRTWISHAHDLHDAVMKTLNAADAKGKDKLLEVGNDIDEACEKCHLQYWYPNEKRPESAPSQRKSD